MTKQDKKNDAANRIVSILGKVYQPNSKLSQEVQSTLATKLTLVELAQLLALVLTSK